MLVRGRVVLIMMIASSIARAQTPEPPDRGNRYESTVHARPKRDRAATVVITAKELQERGVTTLAEALDLVPQVQVRQGGRGDFRLDLRGAKQRSILVLIDGVPVDEPFFGAYDISAIPVTDIVEIRITLSPASPLEGPGGDAAIVEVLTLRASGGRRIDARLAGSSQPGFDGSITGRTPIAGGLSMRASGGGSYYHPGYDLHAPNIAPGTIFHDTRDQAHAALRLEELVKNWRLTLDGNYSHRSFYVPPSQEQIAAVEHVNSEHAARVLAAAEGSFDRGRVAVGGYYTYLSRSIDYFKDYTLMPPPYTHEELAADGAGGAVTGDYNWRSGAHALTVSARAAVDWQRAHDALTVGGMGPQNPSQAWASAAAGVRWDWRRRRAHVGLDFALGVIAAFSGPSPWPEAKLRLSAEPNDHFGIVVIGARKGRLPTLREQSMAIGGPLRPEQTWHVELQAWARPHRLVQLRVAGYWRFTDGLIRQPSPGSMPGMAGMGFKNFDDETVCGVEPALEIAPGKIVGGGVAYLFADDLCKPTNYDVALSTSIGPRFIENFPRHRVDAWLSSSWRGRAGGLLRFRWIDARLDQGSPLQSYYVFDLSAWVKMSRNLRASLRVDNLSNNSYFVRSGVLALGTTVLLAFEGTWE